MKQSVIIVAGGIGKRMRAEVPKQFIRVLDKTILHHTIDCFYSFNPEIQIIVSLNPDWIDYWKVIVSEENVPNHTVVEGGKERFYSVRNALPLLPQQGIVGIHDAVRPFVSQSVLRLLFEKANQKGNAVPSIAVSSSLREVVEGENKMVNRNNYRIIQTPQCFDNELIISAYQQEYSELFTDDASVIESLGQPIHLVEGNEENIKLTTPFDLKIAEVLLGKKLRNNDNP